MNSGRYLSPICRSPKPPAGRGSIPCARFWTPSSTWCAAVAPGASYPTTSHPGRLSTTTSASGGSMVRGSGCTKHFAAGHGYASEGTRSPAPPSSIPRASRPPEWAARGARLRSWQEGEGKEAAFAGGYAGFGDEGEGPRGQRLRPRRDKAAHGTRRRAVPAPLLVVAGRRIQRQGEGQRLGREGVGFERGGRQAAEAVGLGAGGPATAPAPGLHGLAEAMGGREDVLVGRPEPQDEQGLRAAAGELRGVHIRGYDTAHGEAVSTLMRLFRRFLRPLSPLRKHLVA